jgi:hypothetical protein
VEAWAVVKVRQSGLPRDTAGRETLLKVVALESVDTRESHLRRLVRLLVCSGVEGRMDGWLGTYSTMVEKVLEERHLLKR